MSRWCILRNRVHPSHMWCKWRRVVSLSSTSSSLSVAYPNSGQRTVVAQPRPSRFSALVAGLYRTPTASLSDSAALSVDVDPTPTRSSSSESLHVSRTTKRAPSSQYPIARAQPQPDVQGAISTARPLPTTNAVLKAIKACLIANLTGTATMHTGHFPVAKTSTATTAVAIPSRERQNLPAKCVLPGDNGTANECCICHKTLFEGGSFDRFGVDHDVKGLEYALELVWCGKFWKSLHRGCWDGWMRKCTGSEGWTCPLCDTKVG
ncbi:hypothetical protein PM082_023899 [Marasmius tenuissimus]|nr:hypothetical protein PM082_023899 [Marasmius tenuissimus]